MKTSTKLEPTDASLEVTANQKHASDSAHAHPISHPEECSNALARIGLVADGVGPKKPKTGQNHQPGPATEYLLGLVRG